MAARHYTVSILSYWSLCLLLVTVFLTIAQGAPFQWAAIFHKDDVQFVRGHDSLYFYNSSTMEPVHSLPCKISCSNCHSLIMDEGRHVLLLYPELIKHDTGPDRQKLKEIFYPKYDPG